MGTKKCASCQVEKSELDFRKRKNGGLYSYCFDCSKVKAREWNEANKERKKPITENTKEVLEKIEGGIL